MNIFAENFTAVADKYGVQSTNSNGTPMWVSRSVHKIIAGGEIGARVVYPFIVSRKSCPEAGIFPAFCDEKKAAYYEPDTRDAAKPSSTKPNTAADELAEEALAAVERERKALEKAG